MVRHANNPAKKLVTTRHQKKQKNKLNFVAILDLVPLNTKHNSINCCTSPKNSSEQIEHVNPINKLKQNLLTEIPVKKLNV
jgi:hypothetical protein